MFIRRSVNFIIYMYFPYNLNNHFSIGPCWGYIWSCRQIDFTEIGRLVVGGWWLVIVRGCE